MHLTKRLVSSITCDDDADQKYVISVTENTTTVATVLQFGVICDIGHRERMDKSHIHPNSMRLSKDHPYFIMELKYSGDMKFDGFYGLLCQALSLL